MDVFDVGLLVGAMLLAGWGVLAMVARYGKDAVAGRQKVGMTYKRSRW